MNKPLTLRQKQSIFALNIAKLITYAYTLPGYELTVGEFARTDEQQALHLKSGASTVKRSKHQDKLAADLNLFVNGVYQTAQTKESKAYFKPLADYWKSLHPENIAGFDWGWDSNHYQMGK